MPAQGQWIKKVSAIRDGSARLNTDVKIYLIRRKMVFTKHDLANCRCYNDLFHCSGVGKTATMPKFTGGALRWEVTTNIIFNSNEYRAVQNSIFAKSLPSSLFLPITRCLIVALFCTFPPFLVVTSAVKCPIPPAFDISSRSSWAFIFYAMPRVAWQWSWQRCLARPSIHYIQLTAGGSRFYCLYILLWYARSGNSD